MPKICVTSPEIIMTGDIAIKAEISVVTKAKLDSVNVNGNCECEGEAPSITDFVILIDGSDSFNNKVVMKGVTNDAEAFKQTQNWISGLIGNIANSKKADMATVSVVQFSGIKPLERSYKPGKDNGSAGSQGLDHYRVHIAPTRITNANRLKRECTSFEGLDGNGQLFLCLQDLCLAGFTNKLEKALPGAKRERVIIMVCDEEWDIKYLANAFGSGTATPESVSAAVHKVYNSVYAVVVRPNKFNDQNEDMILQHLCNGKKSSYKKVYTQNFDTDMERAGSEILKSLGFEGTRFF